MDFAVLYVNIFDVKHLFEFIFLPQFYDFMHKTLSGCMSVWILHYYVWEYKMGSLLDITFTDKKNGSQCTLLIIRYISKEFRNHFLESSSTNSSSYDEFPIYLFVNLKY